MSDNADTIKDFLISLGFDIDQAGAIKFDTVFEERHSECIESWRGGGRNRTGRRWLYFANR